MIYIGTAHAIAVVKNRKGLNQQQTVSTFAQHITRAFDIRNSETTDTMACDSSYEDTLTSLRISLRNQAGLSSYNPNDTSLPVLPSPQDAIPQLDPSPTYLRCKHCKGRLLRGISSIICVFCGRKQHNKDVPPDPIKFMSTFGSRWFLQSLDLDGSELVESHESTKGQTIPLNEIPLSDFLDLEIRWPSESEKSETSGLGKTLDQRLSSLNLDGVDIDNFFAEGKVNSVSASTGGQLTVNKESNASDTNDAAQGHGDLSLFESVQHSEMVARIDEDESGDPSSSWEAEFQSAGLGTKHQESNSFDSLVASSSVDLSAHMDTVFGPGKDLIDGKQNENTNPSPSNANDWFNVDLWGIPSTAEGGQSEQFKVPLDDTGNRVAGDVNSSSSMDVDWIQGDQLQTSNSKTVDSKTNDEDDEDWNDFTSSSSMQVPSNNSRTEFTNQATQSIEQPSEIDLFGATSTTQEVDFDSFVLPDFFSGTFSNQNGSTELNILQPETSLSDRNAAVRSRDGESAREVEKGQDGLRGGTRSKGDDDVEMLMSQMHDLSFMLESNLSVPQMKDPFGPFSKF